eukprot:scaffold64115_cov65-Phaeocystis_antarctica.AAC.1
MAATEADAHCSGGSTSMQSRCSRFTPRCIEEAADAMVDACRLRDAAGPASFSVRASAENDFRIWCVGKKSVSKRVANRRTSAKSWGASTTRARNSAVLAEYSSWSPALFCSARSDTCDSDGPLAPGAPGAGKGSSKSRVISCSAFGPRIGSTRSAPDDRRGQSRDLAPCFVDPTGRRAALIHVRRREHDKPEERPQSSLYPKHMTVVRSRIPGLHMTIHPPRGPAPGLWPQQPEKRGSVLAEPTL